MRETSKTVSSQRPLWIVAAVLVLFAFCLSACGGSESPAKQAKKGQQAGVRIQTATLQRISIQRQVVLSGTLVSPDEATVSAEVSGVVREVLVELGHEVIPGQLLVRLEPRELELALRQSEAQLHQTEAQLGMDGAPGLEPPPDEEVSAIRTALANREDARAQATRASQLFKQGLLTQADFDTTQTRLKVTEAAYHIAVEQVRSLRATLRQRRAALELAQKKLSDANIKAPIGGAISERLVQTGEFLRENTPVVTIVQTNPLKLKTAIQEKFASLLRPGLQAQFRVESVPEEMFRGKVAYVSPAVDQATRTFPVEILVDNRDRKLKPGFFAQGSILTHRDENVLAAPEATVSTLAGESSVFVVENNKVRKQTVTLGDRIGDLLEVVSGLQGSEILAATSLNELADGVAVTTGAANAESAPGVESGGKGERGKRGGQL